MNKTTVTFLIAWIVCGLSATGCGQREGAFTASIDSHSYDESTKILTIEVIYHNGLNDTVHLVANGFLFPPPGVYQDYGQYVNIVDDGQGLLFDLSHPPILIVADTAMSNSEAVGFDLSKTVEIAPHGELKATYKFRFPLALDWRFSNVGSIAIPHGKRMLHWRVGWGRGRDIESFLSEQRLRSPKRSTGWGAVVFDNALIREQWQNICVAPPCAIDFPLEE